MKKLQDLRGLLLYTPHQFLEEDTPRPDGSLGLLYLASSLEQKKVDVDVLDATIGSKEHSLKDTFHRKIKQDSGLTRIGMSFEEIADFVVKNKYDFVGINAAHTIQTKMAFETAKAIKQASPEIKIYTGGVSARNLYERFLKTGFFDAICLSEGEIIFPRLLEREFSGSGNSKGFAFIHNGKIIVNPVDKTCFPEHLDDLAMPAWEKLLLDRYEEIYSPHGVDVTDTKNTQHRYAPFTTSRGCPNRCLYCHISTEKNDIGKFRLHSLERVVAEIDYLKSLGVRKLFPEDDSPLAGRARVKKMFKAIKDRRMTILGVNGANLIDFYIRGGEKWQVDKELLEILVDAGFEQIVFPAESGCKRILEKYCSGKVKLDKMDLVKLMKTMNGIGIKAPVNMMIGFPDETEQEIGQSIELGARLKDSGAPYVTFFIPTPFPGSRLYEIALQQGYLDRDFNPDLMNYKKPIMKNTVVSIDRLLEIKNKAHEWVNEPAFVQRRIRNTMSYQWKSRQKEIKVI